MNQIAVELNAIEIDTTELQALSTKQIEDAMTELNASQLALIGGGLAIGILD
jgi:putative cell wall-binding protein